MPEMKFFIMYNNTPFVDGETWEPIYFNNFEAANTIFATLPEDMQEDGEIKNIMLLCNDWYEEFGYDYNTVIENDVLSIHVEDDKYKIYDSDGNYFNYLGELSEDFSKQVREIIDILEDKNSDFLPEFNLCLYFDELFSIKETVHQVEYKENKYKYEKDNSKNYINRFGNYYVIQKEE